MMPSTIVASVIAACMIAASAAASKPPTTTAAIVRRFASGTGQVLVSNGFPLPPGYVFPTDVRRLHVYVGDAEQRINVEPLASLHGDGSLRSVLIQFWYALRSDRDELASVTIGSPRSGIDLPAYRAGRSRPAAVILPSDPAYLVATDIVGATLPAEVGTRLGGAYAEYEAKFQEWAEKHWISESDTWENNYYDRALIYYAFWARTGNPEYWRRGTRQAVAYRRRYLEANNYGTSFHWAQLDGLEKHYLLTGDGASRTAIFKVADMWTYDPIQNWVDSPTTDNRIQARILTAFLLARRLSLPQTPAAARWAVYLDSAVTLALRTQRTDGSYRFAGSCDQSQSFMTGMLNDAFMKVYKYHSPDRRLPAAVRRSADYLWAHDWLPAAKAFKYMGDECTINGTREGGPEPAPDLNNLIVNTFGWVYQITRNPIYKTRGDSVFLGATAGAWLDGSKQFNQQYSTSYAYLALRN